MRRDILPDPPAAPNVARLIQVLLLGTTRTQRLHSVSCSGGVLRIHATDGRAFQVLVTELGPTPLPIAQELP